MKNPLVRNIAVVLFLILCVWGVYHVFTKTVDPHLVWQLIKNFSPSTLALVLFFSSGMIVVRAFRFFLLLKDASIDLPFWKVLRVYIAGQALSPLPGGEGARSFLLQLETPTKLSDTVTPLIMLGITETIVAVTIAILGSIFLGVLRTAAVIALIGTLGLVWLLINHKFVRLIFTKLPDHDKLQKAGRAIVKTQKEVHSTIFTRSTWIPSPLFLYNLGLALITDIFGGVIIYILAHYFDVQIGFLLSLYIFAAATVLGELVPFAPGGIGTTEGGMTGILLLSGVALPQSLAIVLLFRVVTLVYGIITGIITMLIFYIKKYIQARRRGGS